MMMWMAHSLTHSPIVAVRGQNFLAHPLFQTLDIHSGISIRGSIFAAMNMSGRDAEVDAAIAAARVTHPECQYTVSNSKSCRAVAGKMDCETVSRVLRYCPGDQRPCEIFVRSLTSEGGTGVGNLSGQQGNAGNAGNDELDQHMRQLHRLFDGFGALGGMFGGGHPFLGRVPPGGGGGGGEGGEGRVRAGSPPAPREGRVHEGQAREAPLPPAPHRYPRGQYPFRPSAAPRSERPPPGDVDEI